MNAPHAEKKYTTKDVAAHFLDYHIPDHEKRPAAMPSMAVLLHTLWEEAQNAVIRQAAVQYKDGQMTCQIGPTDFNFHLGPYRPTETLPTEQK